jgi:hypothetical protein
MNTIDNLIYTYLNTTNGGQDFVSDYETPENNIFDISIYNDPNPGTLPVLENNIYSYPLEMRNKFVSIEDSQIIERAIQKHWFDLKTPYPGLNNPPGYPQSREYSDFSSPPYHLIYAFLLENTRMFQIFEKLLSNYLNDEIHSISVDKDIVNLIYNTENLFFKEIPNFAYRNINSQLRIYSEASRRNAYKRLFSMDLSFGDYRNNEKPYPYYKAKVTNNGFIALFEQFLKEIWQAYINLRNTSGVNTTDYQSIEDIVFRIQQLLLSRRASGDSKINPVKYPYYNLSREEFSAVIMASWFFHIIEYSSPLITFLNCDATTAGERIIKLGEKVGIKAHRKSQFIFELAPSLAYVLREIELGRYDDVESRLNDPDELKIILSVINNWEVTTGHIIKTQTTPIRISR